MNFFKNNLTTNKWWHIGLLIILPALIYFQSINFDYTNFDDNGIILQRFDIVGDILEEKLFNQHQKRFGRH